MADVVVANKALCVNPLKVGQPIGASLAVLGLARAMPLEHGARGCASFNKLFLMRHFREPIALQTTAMDQLTTIIGADDNIVEALETICATDDPDVIGLITTGLSEMQGADVPRSIAAFRTAHPERVGTTVIPISTSDTLGCLETGYALAVEAIIDALVPEGPAKVRRPRQVNILAPSMLTTGDIDVLRDWVAAFGLSAVILPDLGDSLDGHLIPEGFSTLTYGGTTRDAISSMGESAVTLVIGGSLDRAADLLNARTGVPDRRFPTLMGMAAADAFTQALSEISGTPVPHRIRRHRARLADTMVDCQYQLAGARLAVAADADLLDSLTGLFDGVGIETVVAVTPARSPRLAETRVPEVVVGDLEELEIRARERDAEVIVANSHGVDIARRLGIAALRVGYPINDVHGAHALPWIGYEGGRRALFELANLLLAHYRDITPFRSRFRRPDEPTRRSSC